MIGSWGYLTSLSHVPSIFRMSCSTFDRAVNCKSSLSENNYFIMERHIKSETIELVSIDVQLDTQSLGCYWKPIKLFEYRGEI